MEILQVAKTRASPGSNFPRFPKPQQLWPRIPHRCSRVLHPPPPTTVVVFRRALEQNPRKIQGGRTAIRAGTRAPFARRKRQHQILQHRNEHQQDYIATKKRLQQYLCRTHCPCTLVCYLLLSSNPQRASIWEIKKGGARPNKRPQDHPGPTPRGGEGRGR